MFAQFVHFQFALGRLGQELQDFEITGRNAVLALEFAIKGADETAKSAHRLVPFGR